MKKPLQSILSFTITMALLLLFANAGNAQQVSGKIFHDIYANALDGGETAGDANNPGLNTVRVRIFTDDGDGIFDGGDNTMVTNGTTLTNATGDYSLPTSGILSNGVYWVIAYSQTINTGSFNTGYAAANTWMEQTYGSGGAWGGNLRANGVGGTAVMAANGRCFAGKTGTLSDIILNSNTPTAAQLITAEHVVRVTIAGSSVTNVTMGFSFNALTNTGDADLETGNARWAQGSLRQFFNNSNAIPNINTMVFVPSVATNAGGGANSWWSITIGSVLPLIQDDNTIIDGRAYSLNDGSILNNNTGSAPGAPSGAVGVGNDGLEATGDETILPAYNCPELEINGNDQVAVNTGLFSLSNSAWNTSVDNFRCYRLSIYNINTIDISYAIFGSTDATGANQQTWIEECFFGVRANGTPVAAGMELEAGVYVNYQSYATIAKSYFKGLIYTGFIIAGITTAEYNAVLNCGNAINNCGDGISTEERYYFSPFPASNKFIQYNYISGNAAYGMESWNMPGTAFIRNNTVVSNGTIGTCDGTGIFNEDGGVRLFGNNNVVEYNLVKNNPGSGIVVVNRSSSNSVNNRISKNVIYANDRLSLDYQPFNAAANPNGDGVTANNGLYGSGVNNGMDYPVLTLIVVNGNSMHLKGYVGSAPNQAAFAGAAIELFKADDDGNNNGEVILGDGLSRPHGEGRYYLGTITADASGNFDIIITVNPAVVGTGDLITATATLSNNTSEFGVAYVSTILLPVSLANFRAYETQNGIWVKWSTLQETDHGYFTVEKSNNGTTWQPLTVINGNNINSYAVKEYGVLDETPFSGVNYYRLKITGVNLQHTYSKVVRVDVKAYDVKKLFPNPFNGDVTIEIFSKLKQTFTITISDVEGRILKTFYRELNKGNNSYTLDKLEGLKSGIYIIRAKNDDLFFSEKVIKK
jgi:hypothetical protein